MNYKKFIPKNPLKEIRNEVQRLRDDNEYLLDALRDAQRDLEITSVANEWDDRFYSRLEKASNIPTFEEYIKRFPSSICEEFSKKENRNLLEAVYFDVYGSPSSASRIDSTEEAHFFMNASRERSRFSPFLSNVRKNIKRFIVGEGARLEIAHPLLNKVIQKELKRNNFESQHKDWVENLIVDGEIGIEFSFDDEGNVWLSERDPMEIFDIKVHPQDLSRKVAYLIQYDIDNEPKESWIADADYFEMLNDSQIGKGINFSELEGLDENHTMFHLKSTPSKYKRGASPIFSALRWDRLYHDVLIDLAVLMHERSKVVWIKTILGQKGKAEHSRTQRAPKGGTVKVETDNQKWRIENSKISGHINREYGRPLRLAIASATDVPEFMIFGDLQGSNYAALRKGDLPFWQMVGEQQDYWRNSWARIVRKMIQVKVDAEVLPEEIEVESVDSTAINESIGIVASEMIDLQRKSNSDEVYEIADEIIDRVRERVRPILEQGKKLIKVPSREVAISTIFPKSIGENPLILSQALQIHWENKWASTTTIQKILGYDSKMEQALILLENGLNNSPNKNGKVKTKRPRNEPQDSNTAKRVGKSNYVTTDND